MLSWHIMWFGYELQQSLEYYNYSIIVCALNETNANAITFVEISNIIKCYVDVL